eukprot:COSAG02_NODE_26021_length_643_cov_0.720588_1_plen_147_part_01
MRLLKRNRLLDDQLAHYEAKRRECREQSAELSKQRDEIEGFKRQLARAEAEATQQQSSIEEVSGRLSNMRIDRVHEGEQLRALRLEVEELRSTVVQKDTSLQGKDDIIQQQKQLLSKAKAALVDLGHQELERVSDNLSQVSIVSRSG